MGSYPGNLKYTKEHEWAKKSGSAVVVGVTSHAQESLGDVVYVELPKVGDTVTAGKSLGVIESTKAVSELFSPISGKVVKTNTALTDAPQTINEDPWEKGWIVEIEPANASEFDALLDVAAYEQFLSTLK
jgi:glycine cleavage system H protein